MASMSYCVLENTETDFRQCVEKISNINSLDDLSDFEREAAEKLRELANEYIQWFDKLDN